MSILKDAREKAGLTQAELARRVGVTQGAIAQLERPGANPTLRTLERALAATGYGLELRLAPRKSAVDETLLREALRLTPAERIAAAGRLLAGARTIATAGARAPG